MTARTGMAAALIALIALAGSAFAQDDMEARRKAAEAYVNSPAQQEVMKGVASPDVLAAQMRATAPGMSDEEVARASAIAAEELTPMLEEMRSATIEAVAETFTLQEIEAITAFYSTPEGMALATKTGPLMQSVFQRVGPQMQAAQQRIMQRLQQETGQ